MFVAIRTHTYNGKWVVHKPWQPLSAPARAAADGFSGSSAPLAGPSARALCSALTGTLLTSRSLLWRALWQVAVRPRSGYDRVAIRPGRRVRPDRWRPGAGLISGGPGLQPGDHPANPESSGAANLE